MGPTLVKSRGIDPTLGVSECKGSGTCTIAFKELSLESSRSCGSVRCYVKELKKVGQLTATLKSIRPSDVTSEQESLG